MGTYHVFLSCEGDINIGDDCIEEFLSKNLPRDIAIESIKKHDNIILAKEDLDDLEESCIYVVDTHSNFDNITYWELGYAMGKGIEIIGYYDGKTTKNIPTDVEGLISIPQDVIRFLKKINRALSKRKPEEYPLDEDDWNKLQKVSEKEPEAT
jgi:nucleoside 2-deoxyribosyltransferase